NLNADELEQRLTLLGLVAMSDRPREKVEEAIKLCQSAGIRIMMLTGDQSATALAVARELGIVPAEAGSSALVNGSDLQLLSRQTISDVLDRATIIARVTPEMKLEVVRCLQERGHVVAMTGDGINDAPALRQSNIGIAMGQTGTDMACEASDLVITDDNFATIVKAVEQGRMTYANISRAIGYLLTASLTCVIAVTFGLLANTALLLQPLQLLYLNLIMHILPGLGIVLQRNPAGVMSCPPRRATEMLLNRYEKIQIAARSAVIAVASLIAIIIDQRYLGQSTSTTVALATLSLSFIFQSWTWLSEGGENQPLLRFNIPMVWCTAINILLLGVAIYFPPFQMVLNTTSLSADHCLLVLSAAIVSCLASLPLRQLGSEQRASSLVSEKNVVQTVNS
ncbi:MAG TPA: HAD-IC family P-type ATPase, partial [Chroococcales cyanobacterium]